MLVGNYCRNLFFLFLLAEGSIFSFSNSNPLPEIIASNDEDVLEEENSVKQQARERENDPDAVVTIHGLVKTYPKALNIGRGEISPYHAIKVKISWKITA